ncbi:MAG: T9SS type A sorting domain-containing protein [Bacteroidales bacterium]
MKSMIYALKMTALTVVFLLITFIGKGQQVNLVPVTSQQTDFVNAYKLAMQAADNDYHSTSQNFDPSLFPLWGEHSVYWVRSGANAGSFVLPDDIPAGFGIVTSSTESNYQWQNAQHFALQFKASQGSVVIFQSSFQIEGQSVNWESAYFQGIMGNILLGVQWVFDENQLISKGLAENTKLLIIPAFAQFEGDNKVYIDSVFNKFPELISKLNDFLASGGTIYTEGNAAYIAEKLGHLNTGTIQFSNSASPANNYFDITFVANAQPFSFCAENTRVYGSAIPLVTVPAESVIATLNVDNRPVYYQLNNAGGGRILSNLALPAVGGYVDLKSGGRQLQWTYNAILSAFISDIDVTRSVVNQLPPLVNVGNNSVSYDAVDTFNVVVKVRNLSSDMVSNLEIEEEINPYFTFVDVLNGQSANVDGNKLIFSGLSLAPNQEMLITYRLKTPDSNSDLHERVDEFLDRDYLMHASKAHVSYTDAKGINRYTKYRDFADIMFSARLMGDADVNWKNFLGLYYQPFKVFLNLENKERTPAEQTKYVQYIPKDVPFYWSDQSINIPILKTPGGKFVTVLKGSNDESHPDFDIDSDGDPDVWLDTASIYPKGYTLTEETVYWQNPWAHLNGATQAVFEDLDHDGLIAQDTNGDGIVDVPEPGDEMRVWKVNWDINTVPGYQYYEPYCSYEIWIDPPELVDLSKGAAFVNDSIAQGPGMFYPYTADINTANQADTSWSYWMERDNNGNVIWKNLILQSLGNYEGFAYVDDSYQLRPQDQLIGKVPQPHREFLAVVSLGGEEIDMTHPTPTNSMYSNIKYKTIFGEDKTTPIRTTYTYWAPLPNPLQFEYLGQSMILRDSVSADTISVLPKYGKARVSFEVDASTEYTYYWIRNVGYDVDFNDPSLAAEGVDNLGDGVFGYFIYEIPKGIGGYKMSLPKKADGSYDVEAIVQVDETPFKQWINNPNTLNEVKIWEDDFRYQVYIPQVLIPPALDDDNFDGIDDWLDDRGDRFQSQTGYLHDAFMAGNGEDYPAGSLNVYPHQDDIYGTVNEGWSAGADNAYGDDLFEGLGKTHFTINAIYEGKGKEGLVDLGKGGTLVVEEIFGGSPWVIFSHVITGFAEDVDLRLTSTIDPNIVGFGKDTCIVKHVLESLDEPHEFNAGFEPYSLSRGDGSTMATATVGGKDPCSLVSPDVEFHSIVDLDLENANLTLVPMADQSNPDLGGYPKNESGTFTMLKVEVNNVTDENFENTVVTPHFINGNAEVVMSYVAYPRPLVPDDQIGVFKAGWRFNQPEGEVLVKMGNQLKLLQPSRKAYFIFLVKLASNHPKGIFDVSFTATGEKVKYDGTGRTALHLDIPSVKYSITDKNNGGQIIEAQKFVIGQANLQNLVTSNTSILSPLNSVKWSLDDIMPSDFSNVQGTLPVTGSGSETIDLKQFGKFPTLDTSKIVILEKFQTNISKITDTLATTSEEVNYNYNGKLYSVSDSALKFIPLGPMIQVRKQVIAVNGIPYTGAPITISATNVTLDVRVSVVNYGNDIAQNVDVDMEDTENYTVVQSSLPAGCIYAQGVTSCDFGTVIPGQYKEYIIQFNIVEAETNDITSIIDQINSLFKGTFVEESFDATDLVPLKLNAYDFKLLNLSYQQVDNNKITISASAVNRGIDGANVKFRIYPLIDGVVQPNIAESNINNMANTQVAEVNTEYYFGGITGELTLVATIDPDNAYTELFEDNNSAELKFTLTGMEDLNGKDKMLVFPNPSKGEVNFEYSLVREPKSVTVKFYNMNGTEVDEVDAIQSPENYKLGHNIGKLAPGKYIYRITMDYGTDVVNYQGVIVKE